LTETDVYEGEELMKNPDAAKDLAGNPALEEEIRRSAESNELSCAESMRIAAQFGVSPWEVGQRLDAMKIHIVACQLGLFGYKLEKIIVKPADRVSPDLEEEIRASLEGKYLPCVSAWAIAAKRQIPKMAVSSACETLKIKIKPCQIGAF